MKGHHLSNSTKSPRSNNIYQRSRSKPPLLLRIMLKTYEISPIIPEAWPLPEEKTGASSLTSSLLSSVEGQKVDSAAGHLSQDPLVGSAPNVRAQSLGGSFAQKTQEVGTQAGDMRSSHRRAGDGVL
jgi:hypothetical protein